MIRFSDIFLLSLYAKNRIVLGCGCAERYDRSELAWNKEQLN